MPPDERSALLEQLQAGKAAVRSEVSGISEEQARFKPEDGGWSILECMEHIAFAETGMFIAISRMSVPGESARHREESYYRSVINRSRKFDAPERMKPSGRHGSLAAALAAFEESRDRTIRYVESVEDDLRGRRTTHPVVGEITCRECLGLLMGHPLRHADQIREVKASPGFPMA